jgi:hypothetical protein
MEIALKEISKTSAQESSALVGGWLAVFQEHYRSEMTAENTQIYIEGLKGISLAVLNGACKLALEECQFLPKIWDIRARCNQVREEMVSKSLLETKKARKEIYPQAHNCYLKELRAKETDRRRRGIRLLDSDSTSQILRALAPYEAAHVQCQGMIRPTCPTCGLLAKEPFVNPIIKQCKIDQPKKTSAWNPLHKGFLLCEECAWAAKNK